MAQKYLYILEYYVPASHSDGGLLNVIAEHDDECFDLVVEWDQDMWSSHYSKLRENVEKAYKFALADDEESRVVETFVV